MRRQWDGLQDTRKQSAWPVCQLAELPATGVAVITRLVAKRLPTLARLGCQRERE